MQSIKFRSHLITATCVILILTFVYAAIVKGGDPVLFRNQMLQSPLLPSKLIYPLSIFVPAIEGAIVLLLFFEKTRAWGLLFSFGLMLTFTLYMSSLILFFGTNVPCACCGILGQLGYTAHILFNLVLAILSLVGYFLINLHENKTFSI